MRTLVRTRTLWLFVSLALLGAGIFFIRQKSSSDASRRDAELINATVIGASMVPALYSGDEVAIDRAAYASRSPQTGDLVALMSPDKNELAVKRVRAVAEDIVRLEERALYVNNTLLAEGELAQNTQFEYGAEYVVPEGELFLMGDNFGATDSSLLWGFINQNQIIGKVLTE
ncbi:MAG: signal peptidase I [Patescibacteria group bacterium]